MPKPDRYRLRSLADEALERLHAIEARRDAAMEGCFPGPGWREVEAARLEYEQAEARAKAAEGMAHV